MHISQTYIGMDLNADGDNCFLPKLDCKINKPGIDVGFLKRLEIILLCGKEFFPTCVAVEILCLNGTVEVREFLLLKALSLLCVLNLHLKSVVQVFCLRAPSCPHLLSVGQKEVTPKSGLQKQKGK